MLNQVPNLNQYSVNPNDERFGFLPFVGGLAVGALAGGFGGRPCGGPACGPMYGPMPMPMPVPMPVQQQFVPVPIQPLPAQIIPPRPIPPQFQMVQGPLVESNKFFVAR